MRSGGFKDWGSSINFFFMQKKFKAKNVKTSQPVFQFKITLNDSQPKIWRRIVVPKEYSFFDLHVAIQDAMGWTDGHLHGFLIEKEKSSKRRTMMSFPNPEDDWAGEDNDTLDERSQYIADYFGVIVKQCIYTYDFGDSWDHTVFFERELPANTGVKYPQCIAGKNACPPDDCGGVWGYSELQTAIQNPKHPRHGELLEWLGLNHPSQFDPAAFDPSGVQFQNPKKRLKEYEKGFGL